MERRALGQTGMHVSILGFGGAEIGCGHAALKTVDRDCTEHGRPHASCNDHQAVREERGPAPGP
jgi:aryl-alcohol dehydrogenase-like predicted oxidoreductase